ncbi:sentrin-specific protease 8 [Atheta coriaria]|uniref:sentrin-specific protease 8 n=1 Tax=Dalotia coriaria TaxID=877792 RepID=UPI0031F3C2BE
MDYDNPIILNFQESLLRLSDIELLSGPYWLNDTLLSFYFEYLETYKYKQYSMLFIPPQVTQCIKIMEPSEIGAFLNPLDAESKDFIFFALNNNEQTEVSGGSHWSLLVYSFPERKCFHFDSSRGANQKQAVEMSSKVLKFLKVDTYNGFVEARTLPQVNGYDCGVHVLAQCEMLAEYICDYRQIDGAPLLRREQVESKRTDIFNLITFLRGGNEMI